MLAAERIQRDRDPSKEDGTCRLVVTGFGVTTARSWWGRLLAAGLGIAAAAVVDQLARPVCGRCGLAT